MVLGAFIEEAVSDRARGAIETLVKANPQTALIEKNGRTQTKPINAVETGEIAIVRAGDTIPVDGHITEGSGAIDESLLTGEAFPVFKGPGDKLSAGTVNSDGFIKLIVSRTGSDATIGRIIDLIQHAENSKIESTRIVDRYAGYFTPIILTIAALTYFFTRDINRAITVLVVGCPCSFLLAGPVATVATVGRAARSGMMIKGGRYLEKIAQARSFFFDKTGTLTAGKPVITTIRPADGFTQEKLLAMAAAVEQGSTHPIAHAILKKAAKMGLEKKKAIDVAAVPGSGVNAMVDGSVVSMGAGKTDSATGETIVQVTIDGNHAGEIAMLDRVRPDVAETVSQLKALGVTRMSILSGDSKNAVKRVADEIGITDYHYRLKPETKMGIIQKTNSLDTVFVGDGMNDAPSLKASAVGVAMGLRGSDMALATADIVLMKDRISLLPFLIRLSRKMTRTIKINVIISLGINLVAICLGITGLLSPIMGAVAHNVGSILVVMMSSAIAFTRETNLNGRSRFSSQSRPAFDVIKRANKMG
ncbi:heavy metal translocating P-type ATPase A [Desulfosarcina variabilis str. Montpellier]|uniref:heavy metal translocating P-type ATPase n=1 Tax=Desulfosarcina variabilis TaxID=2300 RepID=UPI003AFB49D3